MLGAVAALQLQPSSATDTFVGRSSPTYKASATYHQHFGDDAVYVLVREPLTQLTLTSDLERLLALEGCLSGNVPAGGQPRGGADGPCARLGATKPVQVVLGPGTFINEAVGQIQDEFAAGSRRRGRRPPRPPRQPARSPGPTAGRRPAKTPSPSRRRSSCYTSSTATCCGSARTYGLTGVPQLDDPSFVAQLVFDSSKPAGTPKARFAYLFPTTDAALIQVRLQPDLSRRARPRVGLRPRRRRDARLAPAPRQHYVVTGGPVVVSDLTTSITDSIVVLLIAALLVMAVVLALVFRAAAAAAAARRSRWRRPRHLRRAVARRARR